MNAKREQRKYKKNYRVWVGKYIDLHNLPHWHYDCELLYVERGCLSLHCDKKSYQVNAGQTAFIDSEQIHNMQSLVANTVTSFIIFDYDIINWFSSELMLASPVLAEDYNFTALYDKLKQELNGDTIFCSYNSDCLVCQLLVKIFQKETIVEKKKEVLLVDRFKNLLAETDEKYEFYDLNTAAEYVNMNPSYFSRLFHKLTGITFLQYLNTVKVEKAVNKLKENIDLTMTEIAVQCGFSTIRSFNRIFKKVTGYTPKALPKDFEMDKIISLNIDDTDPNLPGNRLLESSNE